MNKKYDLFNGSDFVERLTKVTNKKQCEVAEDIGKAASIISDWANGRRAPSIEDLLAISQKYKCSIDCLLGIYDIHTNELSISDICRYIMEIDKSLDLHIEIADLLEDNTANYTSRVTMYITPKARNDHRTEALINLINGYKELSNTNLSKEMKQELLNTMYSQLDNEASKVEARAIIEGITRNLSEIGT